MTLTLYDLSAEFLALAAALDDDNEEAIYPALAAIQGEITVKADNIASLVTWLEGMAEAAKHEQVRLAARRARFERDAARLRGYLHENMATLGRSKIQGQRFTVSLRKCPPSVNVVNEAMVPRDYLRYKPAPPPEVDRVKILEAWKADGTEPPGVVIVTDKTSLNIR